MAGQVFPDLVHQERELVYDPSSERVIARAITRFIDLPIKSHTDSNVDPQMASPILAAALRPVAASLFAGDEPSAALIARIGFLREHMPEHAWPVLSDDELPDLLGEACHNCRSLAEVKPRLVDAGELVAVCMRRLLDAEAPLTIQVPTGNRIAVQYSSGKPPVLAVRLQELFGLRRRPASLAARAVLLHLLAPNYRPVQITDDLSSFFTTAYFQVRKISSALSEAFLAGRSVHSDSTIEGPARAKIKNAIEPPSAQNAKKKYSPRRKRSNTEEKNANEFPPLYPVSSVVILSSWRSWRTWRFDFFAARTLYNPVSEEFGMCLLQLGRGFWRCASSERE